VQSESEKNNTFPKKKVRKNARNDPPAVPTDGHSQPQVRSQQVQPQLPYTEQTSNTSSSAVISPKFRLPLSDIRRTYSSLFITAMNSTDPVVLEEFFRKYCTSNLMMLLKYVGPTTASYFGDHVEVMGLETNIQVFPSILASFPDLIFKVLENKIRVIKNGYSSSISKYLFWGTKLFELPTDNDYQSLIYSGLPSSSSAASASAYTFTTPVPLYPSSSLTQSISSSIPSSSLASSHSSTFVMPLPPVSSPLTSSDRLTATSISDKSCSLSVTSLEEDESDQTDSIDNDLQYNNTSNHNSNLPARLRGGNSSDMNSNDISHCLNCSDSNNNGNTVCDHSNNIICAKIPKSFVSSSEFTLKKHLKNLCLSKRYDDLSKPITDQPTINLENTVTTSSFTVGDAIPDPQRVIIVGTINILINPDKQIYKIEFIHSLKQQ
jgi:hypothetical protein